MECDISIESENTPLSPASLVERALSHPILPLRFIGSNGRTLDVTFRPDDELLHPDIKDFPSTSSQISSCHLSGEVHGQLSAINICHSDHISGLLSTPDNHFILDTRNGTFVLLPQTKQNCEFATRVKREERARPAAPRLPDYYSKFNDGKWRYVELALVADSSMFAKYDKDETKVNDRLQSIAHIVNALYFPLKVRVTLVWTEVWKDGDKFSVATSGDRTLDHFLQYRKTFIKEHPNDNAHMLTDIRFEAGVVGKAFKGTMCSYDYSGGVDVDHNTNAASVAATVAHEMGHNFGMEHDVDYGSACSCPGDHCIMAPSTGNSPPSFWSDCSLRYLSNGFNRGIDLCLQNQPEKTVGQAKCGNGIVETGEECDCGDTCINDCCDEKTCKLVGEAECASGDCCDLNTCKAKPRATECRASTDLCDLAEYCNGETFDCPADFFVQDGHICPGRYDEFCYSGLCGSRPDQCEFIWGKQAKVAIPECFNQNRQGIIQGNCGFDVHTQNFSRCAQNDVMCGRLHCETEVERPVFGDPSTVVPAYSYIRMNKDVHQCHVIKTTYVGGKKNQPDPGMVRDGAKCGVDKICVDAQCRFRKDVNKTVSQCNDNCHWRGVCNNVGNCHCHNGFGGIACEIPGYGGSVNSNTANVHRGLTPSLTFLLLCAIFGVVFLIACIYYRVKRKRNIPAELWEYSRKSLKLHGVLEPVRKAPPPPGGRKRNRENLTSVWGDATVTYSTTSRPPTFIPPAIPLMTASPLTSPVPYNSYQKFTAQPPASTVTLNRQPSIRPPVPPPTVPSRPRDSVVEKLYEERGEELGLKQPPAPHKPLPPPPDPYPTSKLSRVESMSRPDKPPPPPPKDTKPSLGKPSLAVKPQLPSKGPTVIEDQKEDVDSKMDVKKMAAMFDKKKKLAN